MLAALLVAMPLLGQGKSADEKGNDRLAQFKEIQKDYQKAVPEVQKALQNAKSAGEHKEVLVKLNKRFAPRILKLVEADPKDDLSIQMMIFSIRALPNVDTKVYDLLTEHWAKDESTSTRFLCQLLVVQPQADSKKFLQKVLEENKNKDIQGYACFGLAKIASQKMSEGDKKASEEAEKYYDRTVKDFANLKLGPMPPLGEQAKDALFEIRHLSVGKAPPNVESQNLDGQKVALKDYKGKVVVLDIWATWCGPCKGMIPHEREMVKKHKDEPFALISISGDEKKDTVQKFLESNEMPWVHWWDGQAGSITKGWRIQAFPTIFVLDPKGVIRYKFVGAVTKELDQAVEKLLAENKEKK
jgi:thiol-disulfide isomerase/thioredoxin